MKTKYLLLTIVAAIGWGFSGTCSEHLFKTYGTNGEWLTSVRLLSAGLLLILISLASGQKQALVGILKDKPDDEISQYFEPAWHGCTSFMKKL